MALTDEMDPPALEEHGRCHQRVACIVPAIIVPLAAAAALLGIGLYCMKRKGPRCVNRVFQCQLKRVHVC